MMCRPPRCSVVAWRLYQASYMTGATPSCTAMAVFRNSQVALPIRCVSLLRRGWRTTTC